MGSTIGIIGAGFTGALLTLHLLRRCSDQDRVLLIEKSPRLGAGLAYSTGNPNHLLNVRAGNMSAFSADPDHFVRWLRDLAPPLRDQLAETPEATGFAPRGLFGAYVRQCLADAIWRGGRGDRLTIISDEVTAIERNADGLMLRLAMGRSVTVDTAVLAIGNFPPHRSQGPVFGDPWDERTTAGLDPEAGVILLGTGLTMVDTVISLLDRGHRGPMHAISRRGLLPRQHVGAIPDDTGEIRLPRPWTFDPPPSGKSLVALMQAVRRTIDRAERLGRGWRSVIDGLRPHTQRLWQELPAEDRRRFLRHLRPWWDVHRHRAAPQVMARIAEARARGQLSIAAARVAGIHADKRGVTVRLNLKGASGRGGETTALSGDRLIDCTGLNGDCTTIEQPLLKQLLADGLVRPDPLKLGLDVTAEGAAIGAAGNATVDLFAIGPITRGAFWEIIAVPDLRVACEQMAARLLPEAEGLRSAAGAQ
ncbi:MAG TPA: FAD/NAD(P)-binding protein [Dongiaceae bacterium]|jgi:uncharacterized NAD(P)/FAD-binding protein YdhS|nr:FAD/NAD(P)-binding protein [Dongiaceae bacterium]